MWIIIALASLVALIILILCIPFDATFRVDIYGSPRFSFRLVWFFGLVSKEIKRKEEAGAKKGSAEAVEKSGWRRLEGIFRAIRAKDLLNQLKVLLKGIYSRLNIRHMRADFKVGLGDPADTGLLFAVINPVLIFLNSTAGCIRVQPSFEGEAVFEGYTQGMVRLLPIQLVPPLLRFIFSLAFLRVIKTAVLTRWKRKK